MTYRLLECFEQTVREKKNPPETELLSAYNEFMDSLQLITDSEQPIIGKLRKLHRLELELEMYQHEAYPVCDALVDIYLTKASALVRMEIALIHFIAEHPGCHTTQPTASERKTGFPSLHWKDSLVNLMELIASLDYSGAVTDEKGNRQSFAAIVMAFEAFFHVSLSKPYDLRADLSRRKKNLSVLLPKLQEAYEKNIVNCGIDRRGNGGESPLSVKGTFCQR